jgi:CRISPR system Cascade subunit CasA
LREYTLDRDSEEVRHQWLISVRDTSNLAWEEYCASVMMGDAWAIRALVKAEEPVRRKLKDLSIEIAKLAPPKEDA